MSYLDSTGVNARLDAAVAAHGHHPADGTQFVTRHGWPPGHEGKSVGYVRINSIRPASPRERWSVALLGGLHARELAPPDALVSFVQRLLAAYTSGSDVTYPAFTSADGVVFDAFTVTAAEVTAVVERVSLVVAPLVNADGRDFVRARLPRAATADDKKLHKEWRKNRRPKPVGETDEHAVGVDLNRNYDIAFDFAKLYDMPRAGVRTSNDPLEDTYCGPKAASEPETANVVRMLRDWDVSFLLDVHSYARTVMYSWGIEDNQSVDPAMSFANPAWDGKRDGAGPGRKAYSEYIPSSHEALARGVATRMCDAIVNRAGGSNATAVRRSTYRPIRSAQLYPVTGTVTDYCFSRWFTSAAVGRPIRPVVSITMEAGGPPGRGPDFDDGEFWPDHTTQYPKIEREIHAAVWSFLTQIAATPVVPASSPPLPKVAPVTGGGSQVCLVATTLYEDAAHPSVAFLRDVRDRQLQATDWGRSFARRLNVAYYRSAPPMAVWLMVHPRLAWLARRLVLAPFIGVLRLLASATGRLPRARSLALSAALALFAGPALAVARAGRWVRSRWNQRPVGHLRRRALRPSADHHDVHSPPSTSGPTSTMTIPPTTESPQPD